MNHFFDIFSRKVMRITGSYKAFVVACVSVVLWAASGSFFHYSETWQLVINTGTTIITFLMVFIIQQSSNRDTLAIHAKLDELIRAVDKADNRVQKIEDKTEEELLKLKER